MFKFGPFYIYFVFIAAIGFMNHVISIPLILQVAGRDAWLSIIASIVPLTIYLFILYTIAKSIYPFSFFKWCEAKIGRPFTLIIVSIFSIHFFGLSFITFLDTINWSSVTYLPQTPKWIIAFFFTLLCFYTAKSGLRTIIILNGILLPFVIIFGYFVMSANIPKKEAPLLFPLFEHGYFPFFKGIMFTFSTLIEIIVILFLLHYAKKRITFLPLLITGIILIYLTLGPTIGAITEFGPIESTKQRYPAYDQWGLVTIGLFIEHVDFLSIYQWLTGASIRVSLFTFLIPEIFHVENEKTRNKILFVIFFLIYIMIFLPISDIRFLYFLSNYYMPISMMIILIFTLFFFILTFKRGNSNDLSN